MSRPPCVESNEVKSQVKESVRAIVSSARFSWPCQPLHMHLSIAARYTVHAPSGPWTIAAATPLLPHPPHICAPLQQHESAGRTAVMQSPRALCIIARSEAIHCNAVCLPSSLTGICSTHDERPRRCTSYIASLSLTSVARRSSSTSLVG